MSRSSNVALAVGVFAVVFAGAWWGLPRLPSKSPAEEPMAFANKPAEVADTFMSFVSDDVDQEQKGPMSEKEVISRAQQSEAKMIVMVAGMKGRKVTLDFVKAAQNDAPPNPALIRYAIIDAGEGKKTICVSRREDGHVMHGQSTFSETNYDESSGGLADYVMSGCAQAIRDHSSVGGQVQFLQKLGSLLPKTPAFDKERQEIAEQIRAIRR